MKSDGASGLCCICLAIGIAIGMAAGVVLAPIIVDQMPDPLYEAIWNLQHWLDPVHTPPLVKGIFPC